MFSISRIWTERSASSNKFSGAIAALTAMSCITLFSSCAHIELQPKDPELQSLQKFANDVTVHLKDTSPATYEQYQSLLIEEVAPGVLNQLKAHGWCAKSAAEAKILAKTQVACIVNLNPTDFPAKATETGLVPVEISGNVVKAGSTTSGKKAAKFHIVYLVGTNRVTHKPIIASVQIR
jgi:hypothetical protein